MKKIAAGIIVGCVGLSITSAYVLVVAQSVGTSVTIGTGVKNIQPQQNAARAGDWARSDAERRAYEEILFGSALSSSTGEGVVDKNENITVTTSTSEFTTSSSEVIISVPVIIPTPIVTPPEGGVSENEDKKGGTGGESDGGAVVVAKLFTYKRTLYWGLRGPDVAELQRALQKKKIPLTIPRGQEGIFGPRTSSAVKTFQKITGLRQTGIVDRATALMINRY